MRKLKLILISAALCLTVPIAAQNPTTYFMEGSTFRSQLNPALAPTCGYLNLPALSGIQVGMAGNISLDCVLFPRNGKLVTIFDNSVSAKEALSGLKSQNTLELNTKVNILGFGAYTKNRRNFWSFDINARVNGDVGLPYSLFEFLKLGRNNKIRGIGVNVDSYLEAGFNYSFSVDRPKKWYVGVRPKMLIGVARARLAFDRFDVMLGEERWQVDAQGVLDITAAGVEADHMPGESFEFGDLDMKPTKPAGYGFAIDLGATYQVLPNLQLSLAVNDLGFIKWGRKHNLKAFSEKTLMFESIEVDANGQVGEQPDFDLNVFQFNETDPSDCTNMLCASINAGLDYELFNHKLGFGLLYSAHVREFDTRHNLTASVNIHPKRWFTLSGSYSFLENRGNAFGLGLNLNPGAINFFVATDVLLTKKTKQWVPIRQSIMNVTFGMAVPIGKIGHRVREYMPARELYRLIKDKPVGELSPTEKRLMQKKSAKFAAEQTETDEKAARKYLEKS